MTNEEKSILQKSILLQDLCARLPYGCYLYVEGPKRLPDNEHISVGFIGGYALNKDGCQDFLINDVLEDLDNGSIVKLILRPMSSMTEEEINEFILISDTILWIGNKRSTCILSLEQMDWLNKKGFDYRGLIQMDLALPATEDMYQQLKTL